VAAGILGGLDNIYIKPGTKLLYLGAAAGTTVSHCSDVVGPEGLVYAVEFSHRPGRGVIVNEHSTEVESPPSPPSPPSPSPPSAPSPPLTSSLSCFML